MEEQYRLYTHSLEAGKYEDPGGGRIWATHNQSLVPNLPKYRTKEQGEAKCVALMNVPLHGNKKPGD